MNARAIAIALCFVGTAPAAAVDLCAETAPCTTSDWIATVAWCAATGPVTGYRLVGTDEDGYFRVKQVGNTLTTTFDQTGMRGDVTFTVAALDGLGGVGAPSPPSRPNRPLAAGGDFDRSGTIVASDFVQWVSAYTRGCDPRVGP